MLGFEAMPDDATPGEWIVVVMPESADPTTPDEEVARFKGEHARHEAERWCRLKEAERADPLGDAGFGPHGKPGLPTWAAVALVACVVGVAVAAWFGGFGTGH